MGELLKQDERREGQESKALEEEREGKVKRKTPKRCDVGEKAAVTQLLKDGENRGGRSGCGRRDKTRHEAKRHEEAGQGKARQGKKCACQ